MRTLCASPYAYSGTAIVNVLCGRRTRPRHGGPDRYVIRLTGRNHDPHRSAIVVHPRSVTFTRLCNIVFHLDAEGGGVEVVQLIGVGGSSIRSQESARLLAV